MMSLTKLKLGAAAVLGACLIGSSLTSLSIAQDVKPKPTVRRLLDIDGDAFPNILVTGQPPFANPKGKSQPKSKMRTVDIGRILDLLDVDTCLDGDAYPDILLVGEDTHLLLTNYRTHLRGGKPGKDAKAVNPKDKSQPKPTKEPLYELQIQVLIDGAEQKKLSMTLPSNVSAKIRITEVLPGGNTIAGIRPDFGIFFQATVVEENLKGVLTELALDQIRLVDGKAVIRRLYGEKHLGKVQGFSFDSMVIRGQLTINVMVQRLGTPGAPEENPQPGAEAAAEKLYRTMEKKVRAAKSLHVALDSEVDSQAIKGTAKATIYATEGNKCRMEIDFDIGGKADKLLFLTDGKARYTKQGDKGTLDPNPKKAGQEGKLVPGTIARIGITGAILMARSVKPGEEKEFDLDKDAPVTNFKLGAKEMVGGKTAQVVTYQLDFDGTPAKMSVWIDTKTQLPLKRVMAVDQDGQMFRVTETYSTFAIDPKLEPKLFEIPNE